MAPEKRFRNLYGSQNISVGHLHVPRVWWPAEGSWATAHRSVRQGGIRVLQYYVIWIGCFSYPCSIIHSHAGHVSRYLVWYVCILPVCMMGASTFRIVKIHHPYDHLRVLDWLFTIRKSHSATVHSWVNEITGMAWLVLFAVLRLRFFVLFLHLLYDRWCILHSGLDKPFRGEFLKRKNRHDYDFKSFFIDWLLVFIVCWFWYPDDRGDVLFDIDYSVFYGYLMD